MIMPPMIMPVRNTEIFIAVFIVVFIEVFIVVFIEAAFEIIDSEIIDSPTFLYYLFGVRLQFNFQR